MVTARTLTSWQIEKVKTYFKVLARLRGENYLVMDDDLLCALTGTYCLIQLEGGGDPLKAAEKTA